MHIPNDMFVYENGYGKGENTVINSLRHMKTLKKQKLCFQKDIYICKKLRLFQAKHQSLFIQV